MCQAFGHSQKLGEAQLLGLVKHLGLYTKCLLPSACSKYFVPHLQVFGSVSTRPKNLEEAGTVFWGGQTLGTYSKRLLKPCLLCQVFGDGQTLGEASSLQKLGFQSPSFWPATLPCTPSIWRWPNVLAVTGKVAGSGANHLGLRAKCLLQKLGFPISKFLAGPAALPRTPSVWR